MQKSPPTPLYHSKPYAPSFFETVIHNDAIHLRLDYSTRPTQLGHKTLLCIFIVLAFPGSYLFSGCTVFTPLPRRWIVTLPYPKTTFRVSLVSSTYPSATGLLIGLSTLRIRLSILRWSRCLVVELLYFFDPQFKPLMQPHKCVAIQRCSETVHFISILTQPRVKKYCNAGWRRDTEFLLMVSM